jgi:CBS domain-containing protein
MTANPRVVAADEPVSSAARVMRDLNVGCLPVVDSKAHLHPIGVITDRDLAVRCMADRHDWACTVGDHMTAGGLVTVTRDTDVTEVVRLMERYQVRRVLVVEDDQLVGIIAQADLALKEGPLEPLLVEHVLERISTPNIALT